MTISEAQLIDEAKLEEFVGRFVGDLGAALHATTVVIGDRLGLYRALAEGSGRYSTHPSIPRRVRWQSS